MFFGLLVLTLVLLFHLYIWKRVVRDTTRPGRARRIGTAVVAGLCLLVIGTVLGSRYAGPAAARWFAWPGFVWFGLMAYLVVVLAVLELPRLALRGWVRREPLRATASTDTATEAAEPADPAPAASSRRLFLARVSAVVAGAASAGLVGTGMVAALGPPELTRVRVPLRRLNPGLAGYRIAVVSDIHLGALRGRGHTERIVRMINEADPDLIAVVGDVVDGTVAELGAAAAPLRDLSARDGAFLVTGNHEYYSGYQPWLTELERLGLHPLRNERTTISRGGAEFDLAGVNDVNGRSFGDGPDFDAALSGRDTGHPVVLLAHQPVQVAGAAERDVDLQLSGHTHGGQLYPFHHVVRLAQPAVAGLSKVDDTWLYVTRGAGFWGPPVRVGAPPEITMVELDVLR
ncbi:MAG TPA: metallophosphoesterase [Actinophytocola sp.]|uniref:metallophosphoesterase n=1 Tax=Actinophytocola sp. TaxID=1872138 RepID=UPI002DBB2DBC|nr:metallophosphoesterase [Actinophytocola sp.]HEU5469712.1 metallophosphoesterase [Actinophytocola sp.]